MKFTLAICIALALVAGYNSSVIPEARFDIDLGTVGPRDTVLNAYHYIRGATTSGQTEDVTFTGTATTNISAIRAMQTNNMGATVQIVAGGVGTNHVTFRFTAAPGRPIFYYVAIVGTWA